MPTHKTLHDLIDSMREPTSDAAREMAEDAADRMVEVTKRNTPVSGGIEDMDHPEHLRDTITRRELLVYPEAGALAYESGAETHVEYAPFVEEGTGLWGPHHAKYVIRPKKPGGWLSWLSSKAFTRRDGTVVPAGTRVFAREVMHPGSPGNHMFAIGAAITQDEFEQIAEEALRRWKNRIEG